MTHSIIFYIILLLNISLNLLVLQSASQHNNFTCKTIIQFARSSSAVAEGFQQNNIETIIVNMHITNVKITKLHSNNGLKTEAGFGVLFFAGGKQSDKMNYIYTPPPSEHLSWIIKIFKFQMREEYFSDSFPVTCWNPIPLSFTTVLVSYPSSCHRLMLQQDRRNDSLILTLTLSWAHPGQERVFDLRWGSFIQWKWSWSENSNKCWKHWSYGQFWMQYMVITGICSFYFKSKYNEIVMNMNEKNLNMNFIIMRYI